MFKGHSFNFLGGWCVQVVISEWTWILLAHLLMAWRWLMRCIFKEYVKVMVDSKQSKQFKAYLRMEFIGISHEEV